MWKMCAAAVIDELSHAFETQAFEVFLRQLRRRLEHLGVCLVDGQVVSRAEADALAARLLELVRGQLGQLAGRPGDALRVLDALRATGFVQLEATRADHERERA